MTEALLNIRNIAIEHIERHQKEINYDDHPRDFIDAYLQEIKSTTDPASSFYKDTGSKNLICPVLALLKAFAII